MPALIDADPEILGGKPIIKGTRIPVDFVFELLGLNYSIEYILDQFPSLTRDVLLQLIQIGKDAQKHLSQVDWQKIMQQETQSP